MRIETCRLCGKQFECNTSSKVCPTCRQDKTCPVCGKVIPWNKVYCSKGCAQVGFKTNEEAHKKISEGRKGISTWDRMTPEQREAANAKRQSTYTDEWRSQRSAQAKALMTDELKAQISNKMTSYWQGNDAEKARRRDIQMALYEDGFGEEISKRTKEALSSPDVRARMSEAHKQLWDSMSEDEKIEFCQKLTDLWTDERREAARVRAKDYQANLSDEERELQRQKKVAYWTPERRIAQGDRFRGDKERAEKIRQGVLRFWGSLSREDREELICKCFSGSHSNVSTGEVEVRDFVTSMTDDVVLNDRHVLGGLELDIYCPKHKFAIEFNGSYYHSVQHMMEKTGRSFYECSKFHQDKSMHCRELGIQLVHIWDWEWDDVRIRERLKSQIRGLLGLSTRVFARKCTLRELSSQEANEFFDVNSEFGRKRGLLKVFGLIYEGSIVMAYGVSYKQSGRGSYDKTALEIGRSATALNTVVVGGSSRLMNAVMKWAKEFHSEIHQIHYFVDFDKHSGSSLKAMGATFVEVTSPSLRIVFNRNVTLVSKQGDTMDVKHGKVYFRMPQFHQAIKEQDILGNLNTLANAGTLHYVFDL